MSKGNRQKAGVKSASSHMAADLLCGGGMTTFDAFSGGCKSLVETEDAVSLKKLAKRDSSTREKALRELMDRCTEENMDMVASTFNNYSALFGKIIFDCCPTVRQLAMKLASKQVNLLKKKAERDLINMLPWIVFATCDPFHPCSSEAITLLNSIFSNEKWDEIMAKINNKLLKILEEILVSGESNLLIASKLMKNDEEDSQEERINRLCEQSYGVLVKIIKGERRADAERILLHRLANLKKKEMSRGLLDAVSKCIDPVSIMSRCSLFEPLMLVFSSSDQSSLLPISTDLLLLFLSSQSLPLNESQKMGVVNTLLSFIKKCGVREWDSIGVRLLPIFSSLSSLVDQPSRATFISNWFSALQSNGIPTKECILYIGDCIKYVLALLPNPSDQEISIALSMMFFLVSQTSSFDPFPLQSLIMWSIPRLNDSKIPIFLEEILRRCIEKLPSSRPLIETLLSLHSNHLFFGWEYLYHNGMPSLPIHLLQNAPDTLLISLNESIDIMNLVEETADPSLSSLYIRLTSLISSSHHKYAPLHYSPLISAVLTSIDDDSRFIRLAEELCDDDRNFCVEDWAKKEETQSIIRLHRLISEKKKHEIEKKLVTMDCSLHFVINVAISSEFSPEYARNVAERLVKGRISQSLDETNNDGVYLCGSNRLIVQTLDIPSTLHLFTDQIMKSNVPIKTSSFPAIATFFYDLIANGMNLLDDSYFFPHIISILSCLNDELTHYSLLSHYWPCSIDILPYRPHASSNLATLTEELNKTLALFLALYAHRSSDSPVGVLLISIVLLSSAIKLARSSPLSFAFPSEAENELLSYSNEMMQSGCDAVEGKDIISLLSHSSAISRPFLIYSLRYLTRSVRNGSLPAGIDTPFSFLPTQGFILHLEMARQLYYGRNVDTVLETVSTHSQLEGTNSKEQMFCLDCDDEHFSLSISALTGANEYLSEGGVRLSQHLVDFLTCAIVTATNSVHSHSPSDSKWEEGRRRLLAAASIQLAIRMNEMMDEEWINFFLPSITPIVLRMYGEIDVMDGSCLSRMVNVFIASHPSLEWCHSWNGQWDKKSLRYDMEMDQAGVPSIIQTMVLRAAAALEEANSEKGEAIVAGSRIIEMSASFTISFSQDEENVMTVVVPSFMKTLALKDGWSRCGVLAGAIAILESERKKERVERSVVCDALAPIITKCLTTIVSKAEYESDRIPSRYFIEKAIPSVDYFLHWIAYLLRQTFSYFPSIIKMWYTNLPKSAATLVNGFISSRLSPILIDREIACVLKGNLAEKYKNDQTSLTIRRHANEILLDYILEDTRMRLSIKMPTSWPLLLPSVSVEGSIVGVEDARKWMLQLNSQLQRNESILSALSAWLVHAGKKVEGADSCTICMMLVAPTTKQLPKARCRTCHNKFHSSCLYKWFESSNQTQCPLCRADFTAPP